MSRIVYVFSEKEIGEYIRNGVQSGYDMYYIKVNNVCSYYYPSDVLIDTTMKNSELWDLIDTKDIPAGMIFVNQNGNRILFNGITLVPTNIENNNICCKGDVWKVDWVNSFKEIKKL